MEIISWNCKRQCTMWKLQTFPLTIFSQKFREINFSITKLHSQCRKVMENAITHKKFREIKSFVTSLVKTLIWRKKVNFLRKNRDRVFHTVVQYHMSEFLICDMKIFILRYATPVHKVKIGEINFAISDTNLLFPS